MVDVASVWELASVEVVALGVLPRHAVLAEDGLSIIMLEAADAFKGIVQPLFIAASSWIVDMLINGETLLTQPEHFV